MDEKRHGQIVESIKKTDPKVIADIIREILHSDDEKTVRRRPSITPDQNFPK